MSIYMSHIGGTQPLEQLPAASMVHISRELELVAELRHSHLACVHPNMCLNC